MYCVVRTLLLVCASWLLAGAWALPRWSRARRTGRRDQLLRRLLTGTVIPAGRSAAQPARLIAVRRPADRLRLGDVVGEAVG